MKLKILVKTRYWQDTTVCLNTYNQRKQNTKQLKTDKTNRIENICLLLVNFRTINDQVCNLPFTDTDIMQHIVCLLTWIKFPINSDHLRNTVCLKISKVKGKPSLQSSGIPWRDSHQKHEDNYSRMMHHSAWSGVSVKICRVSILWILSEDQHLGTFISIKSKELKLNITLYISISRNRKHL